MGLGAINAARRDGTGRSAGATRCANDRPWVMALAVTIGRGAVNAARRLWPVTPRADTRPAAGIKRTGAAPLRAATMGAAQRSGTRVPPATPTVIPAATTADGASRAARKTPGAVAAADTCAAGPANAALPPMRAVNHAAGARKNPKDCATGRPEAASSGLEADIRHTAPPCAFTLGAGAVRFA